MLTDGRFRPEADTESRVPAFIEARICSRTASPRLLTIVPYEFDNLSPKSLVHGIEVVDHGQMVMAC